MGVNTKIILPYHVTTDKIVQVIAKIVGCAYTKETFSEMTSGKNYGKKKEFNPDLPITNDNKWHISFDRDKVYYENTGKKNTDSARLNFEDINGNLHSWFIILEDSQYEEGKILSPSSTTISVAVAKRLVDFFGGYAILNDSGNYENDPDYIYKLSSEKIANIKYPHLNIAREDYDLDPNYRWNLFQNALNNETLLTTKELEEAQKFASYVTPHDEEFYKRVKLQENFDNLTEKVSHIEVKAKDKIVKNKL